MPFTKPNSCQIASSACRTTIVGTILLHAWLVDAESNLTNTRSTVIFGFDDYIHSFARCRHPHAHAGVNFVLFNLRAYVELQLHLYDESHTCSIQ